MIRNNFGIPHHLLMPRVPPDFKQRKGVQKWREENPRHAWALDSMRKYHRVLNPIKNCLYHVGELPPETMGLLWEFANRIEWGDEERPYVPPTREQIDREYWQRLWEATDDQRKV